MKTNATFYKLMYELSNAGVDKERAFQMIDTLLTIRRLARKHHRLAEMECNGEGYVNGRFYSTSDKETFQIKDGFEVSIFDVESDKIEAKIKALVEKLGLRVEFQGDPRGYTVKVFNGDRFIEIN